jgi:hypothetical protein
MRLRAAWRTSTARSTYSCRCAGRAGKGWRRPAALPPPPGVVQSGVVCAPCRRAAWPAPNGPCSRQGRVRRLGAAVAAPLAAPPAPGTHAPPPLSTHPHPCTPATPQPRNPTPHMPHMPHMPHTCPTRPLPQAYVSRARVDSFSLVADMMYCSQNAPRICRALHEICLRRKWSTAAEVRRSAAAAAPAGCGPPWRRGWPLGTARAPRPGPALWMERCSRGWRRARACLPLTAPVTRR